MSASGQRQRLALWPAWARSCGRYERTNGSTDQWRWITTIFGSGGAGLAALAGMDWQTVTAIGALALGGLIIALLLRRQIVCAVKEVRKAIEG